MRWLHCLLLQPTLKLATSTPSNRHAGFIKTTHHKSAPRKRIKHTFYKFVDLAQGTPPWFTITPHTHTNTHTHSHTRGKRGGGYFLQFPRASDEHRFSVEGVLYTSFLELGFEHRAVERCLHLKTHCLCDRTISFFLLGSGPLSVRGPSRLRLVFCWGAGMATLPGTMPRMMRPAPGQNYPRTGFPLEGEI